MAPTHELGKGSEPDKNDAPRLAERPEGEPDTQWPASGKWENPFEFKGAPEVKRQPQTQVPKK